MNDCTKPDLQSHNPLAYEQLSPLGKWLEKNKSPNLCLLWRKIFFVALALVAAISLFVPNKHPHFGLDAYPMFWPLFGLGVGLLMIFLVKKIIQPLIKRAEDHYGEL
ncbi:MAG: hypothetical protein ACRCTY_05390 [Candidatus Adiutrix sp.]